jgi:hypothetical protein
VSSNNSNENIFKRMAEMSQQAKNEAGTKSKKRVNINLKLVILIAVYVSSLFVTAIKEFVSADMSIAYILSYEFLSDMVLNTLNNWMILLAIFVYLLDKNIRSKEMKDLKNIVHDKAQKLKMSIFSLFLNNFNRERRKNKYKHILEQQLSKLEKDASQEDYLVYLKGTQEEKDNNSYCVKKKDLLNRMSKENLEKEIDEVYVNIKDTTSSFVKYGYTKSTNGYEDPWDIESGVSKFIRDLGPKILLGLALLFAVQSIRLEPSAVVDWKSAVVAIVFRLYPIGVHTYIGFKYANQYYEEKIIVDIGKRYDILEQALEYQDNFEQGKIKIEERTTVEHPVVIYKGVGAHG